MTPSAIDQLCRVMAVSLAAVLILIATPAVRGASDAERSPSAGATPAGAVKENPRRSQVRHAGYVFAGDRRGPPPEVHRQLSHEERGIDPVQPPARQPAPDGSAGSALDRKLPPKGEQASGLNLRREAGGKPQTAGGTLLAGLGSLAVVLGLFLVFAWAMRRAMPPGSVTLPTEVLEVLGRATLTGRQQAYLVRCGNKLLLVHLAAGCAETLTEITDPVEVDRLAGLCRQVHPRSTSSSFRQILEQFGREKPAHSFIDAPAALAAAPGEHTHA